MHTSWAVVVPLKRLPLAKTRLSAYGDALRTALALAFTADVVAAALAVPEVRHVLLVTDDEEAGAVARALGATVVADRPGTGLSPAMAYGAQLLLDADPALAVAAVTADLPALRSSDLRSVLAQPGRGERAFVPDTSGSGTTVLAAAPGVVLAPAFGPFSARRHRESGARPLRAARGVRRDVDTPADLDDALRLGVGSHTRAVVATADGLAS